MQLPIPEVKRKHGLNALRNFLSVSADILHRSASNAPRNAAQAFNASAIVGDNECYEFIPVFASACFEHNFIMPVPVIDSSDANL
jgi:hypothetical protein